MLILSPDSACDICLDNYVNEGGKAPASLGCGHTFCRSCIYTLATRVCPVCRQPFSVTEDMRKLHIDLGSRFSHEVTKREMRALESCRSGDLALMEEGISEIEQWLQSQSPGFRCSLPTVVALVRLLMEATSQLHEALERSQTDERELRLRQELDSMKAAAERKRLLQETEALRVGMVRQREHLAYLESELVKARENAAPVAQPRASQPAVTTPKRPALPALPRAITPLQNSNSTVPKSSPSLMALDSYTVFPPNASRPTTPTKPPQNGLSLAESITSTFTFVPPPRRKSLRPSTAPTKSLLPSTPPMPVQQGVTLISPAPNTLEVTAPTRRKSRTGLHGPRERNTTGEETRIEPPRPPPGAAPSAYTPVVSKPPSPKPSESIESFISSHESRRSSLPVTISRPQAYSAPYSFDAPTRRQRLSAQPTSSWRPLDSFPFSQDAADRSTLPYLSTSESREAPLITPARPTRPQPPSTIDNSSLSRKRALRRQTKDTFV